MIIAQEKFIANLASKLQEQNGFTKFEWLNPSFIFLVTLHLKDCEYHVWSWLLITSLH